MPNYQAITKSQYAHKRWLRTSSYAFAMKDAILPLSLAELSRAMMTLPIALIRQNNGFLPAAVTSLQPERNFCVTADGRWIHGYVPAACRSYPFRFLNSPEGQQVLCIDEDSGLVHEGVEGEAFFDEEGKATLAVQEILAFLNQAEQGKTASMAACAVLAQHHLIVPWPITLTTETGEKQIDGLYKIDEPALNQLSAEALLEVRNAGGLLIAYCQLLSMQHLSILGQLAEAHAKADQAAAEAANSMFQNGELNIEFLKKNETLSFTGF